MQFAMNADPELFWQLSQWQMNICSGVPVSWYWMALQRQEPDLVDDISGPRDDGQERSEKRWCELESPMRVYFRQLWLRTGRVWFKGRRPGYIPRLLAANRSAGRTRQQVSLVLTSEDTRTFSAILVVSRIRKTIHSIQDIPVPWLSEVLSIHMSARCKYTVAEVIWGLNVVEQEPVPIRRYDLRLFHLFLTIASQAPASG